MVGEITKDRSPLLPDRQEQKDFFVCDIFDAAPKGDMASMAHPIFSLSTKPDHRRRRYESGTNYLEVKPSSEGLATIHDRDVLIYCISQIMSALNDGNKVSQTVRVKAYDLLKATNRVTDGRGYEGMRAALVRLQGTQIETNIVTGGQEQIDIFSIIDRARIVRETRDGRMQEVEIKLSDWVFNAIKHQEVLTLHRDYFRLRKPLERRIYELARKHCGRQPEWKIALHLLQENSAVQAQPYESSVALCDPLLNKMKRMDICLITLCASMRMTVSSFATDSVCALPFWRSCRTILHHCRAMCMPKPEMRHLDGMFVILSRNGDAGARKKKSPPSALMPII